MKCAKDRATPAYLLQYLHMVNIQTVRDRTSRFSLLTWLLIASVCWLIIAGILWWFIVYSNPKHVFESMLENNFTTRGFTREYETEQQGVSTKVQAQIMYGEQNIVRTLTTLKQNKDVVITDSISTPQQDFTRYVKIDTKQKSPNGKPLDFKKAVNVWAKNDNNSGTNQVLNQAVFGLLPMAYVPAQDRGQLLDLIKEHNVFSVDYNSVKKETKDGRLVYTYKVQLLPQPYIDMLKSYGKAIGFGDQVANLDPADYANAAPTDLVVTIDVLSRHLTSLTYGSTQAKRTEHYAGYGIVKAIELPAKTITAQELQQRLAPQ